MQSILKEFALGNINPDDGFFKKDSHYGRVIKAISDSEEKLLSMLDGESKETLIQLTGAQLEANSISNMDKFIYGYRLGMLMTMEVFEGREDAIFGRRDSR